MTHIRANLEAIRDRIGESCARAGRQVDEVTLVAVSKTFPLEALVGANVCGQAHFGENKAQELQMKTQSWVVAPGGAGSTSDSMVAPGSSLAPSPAAASNAAATSGHTSTPDPVWHMIGHLQRNKAGVVAECADVFHALDSLRLARALDRRCIDAGRTLDCFIQVNVSGEASKFGLDPADARQLVEDVIPLEGFRIVGFMTLAAATEDPEEVRPQFARLRGVLESVSDLRSDRHPLDSLSMGMSGDFGIAIEEGATHVRVGSAIFGSRSYL